MALPVPKSSLVKRPVGELEPVGEATQLGRHAHFLHWQRAKLAAYGLCTCAEESSESSSRLLFRQTNITAQKTLKMFLK